MYTSMILYSTCYGNLIMICQWGNHSSVNVKEKKRKAMLECNGINTSILKCLIFSEKIQVKVMKRKRMKEGIDRYTSYQTRENLIICIDKSNYLIKKNIILGGLRYHFTVMYVYILSGIFLPLIWLLTETASGSFVCFPFNLPEVINKG